MKKSILAAALLAAGFVGTAQAALVTVPFQYIVNFADSTVSAELGLSNGSLFSGSATYDNATSPDALGVYNATAFSLSFGSLNFTEANNLPSSFPVGVGVGPTNNLTALYFETVFTLASTPSAGDYLLSFAGTDAQLTPSGDLFDFKVTASAVPLPAALPLLFAGLGVMGFVGRRRRQTEA